MAVLETLGQPAEQYERARSGLALLDFSEQGWLEVSGADAASYLHRMSSNDVESLAVGRGCHALLLSPRGRIQAELWIYRVAAERFMVELPAGESEKVTKRLKMFILRSQVAIRDAQSERVLLSLQGSEAQALLAGLGVSALPPPYAHRELVVAGQSLRLFRRDRLPSPGVDLVMSPEAAPAVAKELVGRLGEKGAVIGAEAWELLRLENRVPRPGKESSDDVMPLEAYLDLDAIHFDKGCYPGQEVVAKTRYRGQAPRLLVGLDFEGGELPAEGAELQLDGRRVGVVTSRAELPDGRRLGLGFVKRDIASRGGEVELAAGGRARLTALGPTG